MALDGRPVAPSDRGSIQRVEYGALVLQDDGAWYETVSAAGVRQLTLYPTPGSAQTLELEWVFSPPPFDSASPNAEPSEFPEWWHPKLVHFVAEVYYESIEDNPELAEVQKAKADFAVGELARYDNQRRTGNGVFRVPIAGVTS